MDTADGTVRSRHVSRVIARPPDHVYAFAADPANLPRWAAGLARSEVRQEGDTLVADSPMGEVRVRFAERNEHGILDHDVTLPSGTTVHNPVRVLAHPDGSEIVFTVRQIELTDEEFDRDTRMVAADLATLAAILESRQAERSTAMARKIATNTTVGRDELLEFVRPRHRMVLITGRDDGTPQASPVTGGVDDDGRLVIATYPQRAKTRNARRRPRVSVVVLSDEWNDAWVQIDGTAEVIDAHDDVEPFVEYFRNISGEHSDWDEYRQAMRDQGKSLLRITPTRWGPISTGGFPPSLQNDG